MTIKNRTIFAGDNLHVLLEMEAESVDLIYLDPLFNSNANAAPIGSAAFKDTWNEDDEDLAYYGELAEKRPSLCTILGEREGDPREVDVLSYLIYTAVRLLEMRRVLKATGSLWLHCDDTASLLISRG